MPLLQKNAMVEEDFALSVSDIHRSKERSRHSSVFTAAEPVRRYFLKMAKPH